MRRALVLILLLGGMQLLLPLGSAGQGSLPLLAFGFLILGAYTVGEIARDLDLPKIVGYLVAGVLFGPFMLNAVPADAVARLTPVSTLAVALIAFLAGAELRWSEVKERGAKLSILMLTEMSFTFVVIFAAVYFTAGYLPFLGDLQPTEKVVFTLLVASVATVHSPAATMGVLSETGARGPL